MTGAVHVAESCWRPGEKKKNTKNGSDALSRAPIHRPRPQPGAGQRARLLRLRADEGAAVVGHRLRVAVPVPPIVLSRAPSNCLQKCQGASEMKLAHLLKKKSIGNIAYNFLSSRLYGFVFQSTPFSRLERNAVLRHGHGSKSKVNIRFNPTTKTGSKMVGEFTYQPKMGCRLTVLTTTAPLRNPNWFGPFSRKCLAAGLEDSSFLSREHGTFPILGNSVASAPLHKKFNF